MGGEPRGSTPAERRASHVDLVQAPLTFFARDGQDETGPLSESDVRGRLRDGSFLPIVLLRLEGTDLWAPAAAWVPFAASGSELDLPSAPDGDSDPPTLPTVYASAPTRVLDQLLYALLHEGRVFGPFSGTSLRRSVNVGRFEGARLCVLGTQSWYPVDRFFGTRSSVPTPMPRAESSPEVTAVSSFEPTAAGHAAQMGRHVTVTCPICLESIPPVTLCPECGEPTSAYAGPPSEGLPGSIGPDDLDQGWLRMHWRPLVTLGAITALICVGITLRFLAPGRFHQESAAPAASPPVQTCADACWTDESCQVEHCTWNPPGDVGHVGPDPIVAGPFELPPDASDVLLLDGDRFAVALIAGAQIRSARTGEVEAIVSEALHTRRLLRAGPETLYAIAPQHVYVIDAGTRKLSKTLELGGYIGDVALAASGRRVLVSLPGTSSIAIIATEFHAEIDRIRFGDDPVGPLAADDTGKRAITTTGHIPATGLKGQEGGAAYVFDPSRLASAQDRVRTSMRGNPVSAVLTPDGRTGYVVLREKNELVRLEWQPSGAVRQAERIATCRQPEEIVLLRRDRRAIVRCRAGGSLEIFELETGKLLAHVPLPEAPSDLVVSPDGRQALVAMPGRVKGSVAFVDLDEYRAETVALAGNPTRVRFAPDGRSAIVLSDRTKAAWVVR